MQSSYPNMFMSSKYGSTLAIYTWKHLEGSGYYTSGVKQSATEFDVKNALY